jgi:hypothetical protein
MASVTKKLEDTVKALDQRQLKKALYLTENAKTIKQHEFVEEAARTCLANKSDKVACEKSIKEARNKVQETISLPIDDTSLEGLEEYLSPEKPSGNGNENGNEKTDEELYQACPECHISTAVIKFGEVCNKNPEEAGAACELIPKKVEANAEPVDWLKTMIEITEQAKGNAKEEMQESLTELTDYLESKQSPWLKELGKEVNNA